MIEIPSQQGRLAVITGATGGIGYETALALARAGAEVILTGRNAAKGERALSEIRAVHPEANVVYRHLDLADLASVRAFATSFQRPLDVLINNAGVMAPPRRLTTRDGFELQFGTNYLGHYALTSLLLPWLRRGRSARVVQVSSSAHRLGGAIHFDDLQSERCYSWLTYSHSKLAQLLFSLELQRRSDLHGWGLLCTAAHPGYARTELIANGPGSTNPVQNALRFIMEPLTSQSAADGAMPTLYAATSPQARPNGYYGPRDCFELRGPVIEATRSRRAGDPEVARRLWDVSRELVGASWPEEQVSLSGAGN